MLNAALGVGIGLLVSWGTKKITEAAQRVQNVATQSKEAADAAQSATSSLKDLVNAYEELGDKSGWDTDDFDQAKDIQAEILDLAKEQGTLDEDKLSKLNLQNGKYEEQLGLLQDITAEQLEASRYELTQNKDAQGDKLVDTAKKNNRTHYLTVWSAPEMDMGDQIKNAGIDVFNKFGGYGPDDLNDADSIIDYYNEVGKALKYVIDHTTEAERAAGGTYHSLYQFLLDEQSALRDDVDSYNDSTDAINNNTNARRKLQAIDFWSDGKSNGMDVSYSFDKVNSAIETLKNTIDDFDASKLNDLLWGTNEGLTDEQAQALAALRKALTDMDFSADTDGVNAFIQALVQVGIVAQSSANGVDALAAGAQKMEDISSKMDEIQSAYKASTSAMEEYNQYGYMSLDSLQSLLTMNTEYLNCLELVNGKLQINKQSYAELLAAEYAEAAATILSNAQHEVANLTADDTAESTDGLKEKTEAEKTALENLLPALKNATAATATYSAAQEFANEVEKAGERGVDPAKLEEITNRTNTQLSLLYTNMNAALKGGQALTNQLNGFGSSSKNAGKSSSATSKSVADLSSAFDTLTKAMKEYNQYGYISADTIKSLIGVDDKFTACLTEQNGKLELNTAKFRTFVRAQLEEANAANDGGKSAGEMKKILDWLNSSVDSETISFEQLTDAIKGYGTAMDEAKEKTDAIKSAFSGLYDIQQKIKNSQFGVGDLDATESKIESILQLSKFFGDNKDLMDNLVDKNGNINLNTEAFKQATLKELDKRIEAANQTGGAAATALANSLSSDKANIESGKISVSDYLVGLGTDLERVNTELDKYQTNWSTLKDAMDEWNTTGQLTQDTMQKLQELPEEFSNLLTYDEDGNAKIDVKALRQRRKFMAWLDYDGLLYFWQKIKAKLADKVDKVDGKGLSTNDFSAAYKAKLDGIANGANNYSHPTSSGNKHIPAGGSAGQILRWSSDGTAQWGNDNNTTYSAFKGATSSAAGGSGLVPAPTTTNATQYLRGDGTWATPPDTKYNNASTSSAGLMSSGDKAKLDGIAANANNYAHPTSAGNKHIPAGGSAGQILRWSADGTAQWGNDNNTTYSDMKGATTEAAGVHGLAPAPAAGAANRYLCSDGTWKVPPDTNTTYGTFKAATASAAGGSGLVPAPAAGKQGQYLRGDGTWSTPTNTTYSDATQSTHGLMSTSDKKKLDGFGAANTYALKSDITAMYRYKGSVASTDKLPTSGQTIGDVYDVGNGMNYAWNGSKWDALGEIFTITKITNTEIDNVLAS